MYPLYLYPLGLEKYLSDTKIQTLASRTQRANADLVFSSQQLAAIPESN